MSCTHALLCHIIAGIVEDALWDLVQIILLMISITSTVESTVTFHVPALAEHFINEVHAVFIIEGVKICA